MPRLRTAISDAVMPMRALVVVEGSVEDLLGCRLAWSHGVILTTSLVIRIVIIHVGRATTDALGAAASLATMLLSLNFTGRGTCIDGNRALRCLKLASGDLVRRDGLGLLS